MDNLSINPDLANNLSDKDKKDLHQFIQGESQKANIQNMVHDLTDRCFKKCITSKISQGGLDRYEEPCMRNCVDRFMDASQAVVEHIQKMQR
ncbi:Mitochondrial import inner membrane translocase subunit TIM8 [Cercospora beticola]|uniref:Mitochondrial import inner membrane translocase subunit n=3 Tax=Cercospora TaxID=29002 RepID=A0A2S6CI64_9PEZI|nr:Mitochondrial import inner membrane translocase subunit TIM8 [Cercospora beticola]XP_044662251.1 protein transporter TIM8 [Cercospora kikuchii]PPJ59401.1 hypothetical protein CBER1_06919 [Cercospora berteroae]PIA92315.1 Mitochondrial import inner membrane translocase subunit TIM8 [Cercospora beticola]WPB05992.1 hypothetical protein RHO25_010647 [Cercospora beticola]CAK1365870.1 unnamed protein product [Cercospora beticola]GIZ47764.1 hypothetical protein CKM354_001084700 [Cercospora kikuchi